MRKSSFLGYLLDSGWPADAARQVLSYDEAISDSEHVPLCFQIRMYI